MRITPFVISLLVSLFGALPCAAETPIFSCTSSPKLTKNESQIVRQKVQSAYAKIDNFQADFSQSSYLQALDTSEISHGTVSFQKPGKMKWHYQHPEEQFFVLSAQTFWLYQVADAQVTIDDISNVLLTDLPVSFIMGIGDLERDFDLLSACTSDQGIILNLKPKAKTQVKKEQEQSLDSFSLLVNPKDYFPQGAEVHDSSGNVTSIRFSKVVPNVKLSESEFTLNYPKGVDIVDRRNK